MASRIARKITKAVLSREQMDGDGARGKNNNIILIHIEIQLLT